jgi:hypothetical protein
MKRMMIPIVTLFAAVSAYPQTPPSDWSWTFLRNGETCGLLFEDTNLTAPVKAVIRDEVCQSYSFIAVANRYTKTYAPGHPQYGIFVGADGAQGNNGCAEWLGGWKYKLHNGNRYFHIERELSARFLQAVALTNQHRAAVGSLTNFLHAFNSTTTNNIVPSDYLQLWWSVDQEVPLSPAFSLRGGEPDFKSDADIVQFCGQFCKYEIIAPSILNFRHTDGEPITGLWCEAVFRRRDTGEYEHDWGILDLF